MIAVDYSFIPAQNPAIASYKIHYGDKTSSRMASIVTIFDIVPGNDGRIHCTINNLEQNKTYLFVVIALDGQSQKLKASSALQFSTTADPLLGYMSLTETDNFKARIKPLTN